MKWSLQENRFKDTRNNSYIDPHYIILVMKLTVAPQKIVCCQTLNNIQVNHILKMKWPLLHKSLSAAEYWTTTKSIWLVTIVLWQTIWLIHPLLRKLTLHLWASVPTPIHFATQNFPKEILQHSIKSGKTGSNGMEFLKNRQTCTRAHAHIKILVSFPKTTYMNPSKSYKVMLILIVKYFFFILCCTWISSSILFWNQKVRNNKLTMILKKINTTETVIHTWKL